MKRRCDDDWNESKYGDETKQEEDEYEEEWKTDDVDEGEDVDEVEDEDENNNENTNGMSATLQNKRLKLLKRYEMSQSVMSNATFKDMDYKHGEFVKKCLGQDSPLDVWAGHVWKAKTLHDVTTTLFAMYDGYTRHIRENVFSLFDMARQCKNEPIQFGVMLNDAINDEWRIIRVRKLHEVEEFAAFPSCLLQLTEAYLPHTFIQQCNFVVVERHSIFQNPILFLSHIFYADSVVHYSEDRVHTQLSVYFESLTASLSRPEFMLLLKAMVLLSWGHVAPWKSSLAKEMIRENRWSPFVRKPNDAIRFLFSIMPPLPGVTKDQLYASVQTVAQTITR